MIKVIPYSPTISIDEPIIIYVRNTGDKNLLTGIFKKIFDACDHGWNYAGKAVALTRHSLNFSIKTVVEKCDLHEKISGVATKLKFFSIVSVPFSIASAISTFQKIIKSFQLKDFEGIALASLSFTVINLDIFDSITTFINTGLLVAYNAPLEFISILGMPVTFALIGLGSCSRIIQMVKTHNLGKNLFEEVLSKKSNESSDVDLLPAALKEFLEKKLEVKETDPEYLDLIKNMEKADDRKKVLKNLVEKKKAALQRSSTPEVVKKFERLFELVKSDTIDDDVTKEISDLLDEIVSNLKKR